MPPRERAPTPHPTLATERDFLSAPHRSLFELIEAQARRSPDSVAVRFEGGRLTYAELRRRSSVLAERLRGLGVGPDVLVTIFAERSIELVVGLLGTLEAGGAYVPVDPGYPRARVEYMMGDAGAPVTLTQSHLVDSMPECGGTVIVLDGDDPAPQGQSTPRRDPAPSNLAYVIYTSGSTGRPKGVMNTHAGICNRLTWMQEQFGLTAADRVLQKTPYSFDVSVWEFFWPLMTGARLVVAKPEGHLDPSYLAELIHAERVSVLHFVPSMLHLFLEAEDLLERCASLRLVVCSGEAMTPALVQKFFDRLGPTGAELYNLYGPTEAAVDVTYWRCVPDMEGLVPIGRPVSNTTIHILDDEMSPMPVGQEGELYIGGVQVARGYLNRPELTAERFLPDPFSVEADARLYKTGDLARAREDGAVEFLGRADDQVKVRGFRIELGEVETVIETHPDVSQAVVVAREEVEMDKRLVAYVAPAAGRPPPTTTALRRFAAARLPAYMVPAVFIGVERLPLMPNGKVDRASLPDPQRQRPELDQPFVGPQDDFQRHVAEEWARILNLERVGIRDRFFELGGDSLQAARFVQNMRDLLDEFVYVTTIYEAPTIEEYSQLLRTEYPDAVTSRFGGGSADPKRPGRPSHDGRSRVDERMLRSFMSLVPTVPLDEVSEDAPGRNPRAVFIVSPPRSGTTLLRVMLAGHPHLFAASELQLLGFHSLRQRETAYSGKYALWLEGTIRVLMELLECDAEVAKAKMAEFVDGDLTTKRFFRELQALIGDRVLVDKSPSYALDPGALEKAERDFEEPFFIHLLRHPYSMTRSFERYHMDQVLYLEPHPFAGRQLGELVWTSSHRNILEFLAGVPEARQYRIRYEDLVVRPEDIMQGLCERLGIEFHRGLVEPYEDLDRKMTDGLYASSTPMGDTKLLERTSIDASAAETWKDVIDDDFLGDVTWEIAGRFGYGRADPDDGRPTRRDRRRAVAGLRERRRGSGEGR